MKILITGFDAFGGETINPSWEAVQRLPDKILDAQIIKQQLPTVYKRSMIKLNSFIDKYDPDVIINIGQACGRPNITIERIGINIDDSSMPDNDGYLPNDEPIHEDGKNAYFSNLPIKYMIDYMKSKGVKANISNSAGTYVCNHVLYGVQYLIDKKFVNKQSGFIHIPIIKEQLNGKDVPSMELEDIIKGIQYAVEAIVLNNKD